MRNQRTASTSSSPHPLSVAVEQSEVEPGSEIALLGGRTKPPRGLERVLRDAAPAPIRHGEAELRARVPLLRREAKPAGRGTGVGGKTLAVLEHRPQRVLRFRTAPLRGQAVPAPGLGRIGAIPPATSENDAELVRCLGMAPRRRHGAAREPRACHDR